MLAFWWVLLLFFRGYLRIQMFILCSDCFDCMLFVCHMYSVLLGTEEGVWSPGPGVTDRYESPGIKHRSSVRAAYALSHRAVSPAL